MTLKDQFRDNLIFDIFRLMEKLDSVIQRIDKQDKEIENMKNSLKDIKARI